LRRSPRAETTGEKGIPLPRHAAEFEVTSEIRDGTRVIGVRGELDLSTHEQLRKALSKATKGDEAIVMDLSECEFMDSTGVRAILIGMRDAGDQGRFAIAGPTPQVQRILEMTGLGKAVAVHAGLPEALASMGE
jgi:anti-anti-sigma factor